VGRHHGGAVKGKYVGEFRTIGVEAVEAK